ncbi:MAG: glycosyltransferase family 39 protein, partial [Anaerolineales bacterium]|nr:glycosyltransferase family 39 protein [Anaerolineales bacterium]
MTESPRSFFGRDHVLVLVVLVVLFVTAAAIRLYDLTDLPLDFHPTRQLFSALKARGMYYETLADAPADQRAFAIQQGRLRATIEPEILERLTVFTWKFTGEQLWVARIYSSLFWLLGGIFIYLLARDLFSKDGALFAAAFYLLLPYA